MKIYSTLAALALAIGAHAASVANVLSDISTVSTDVTNLNNAINGFSGTNLVAALVCFENYWHMQTNTQISILTIRLSTPMPAL